MTAVGVLLCVLLGAAEVAPHVERTLEPASPLLGEPFVYRVALTHDAQARYEFDDGALAATAQGHEAPGGVAYLGHQRRREGNKTIFELRFVLLDVDAQTLPELKFSASDQAGQGTVNVPAMPVTAGSNLPPDAMTSGADLRDIHPPQDVWMPSYRVLWWALGVLGAAMGGFLLWKWWKRRSRRPVPAAPPLPLAQRAQQALWALESEHLPQQGRVREYYFRLSNILRGYLGERFDIDALECTSVELMSRLSAVRPFGVRLSEIDAFLNEADLAKFARAVPLVEQTEGALRFAQKLVQDTMPLPAHDAGSPVSAS
ncbi:MAG: DUF4381 family protein [Myxococcaceae bacterium]